VFVHISSVRYIPPNFTDTVSAAQEIQPGEWRRVVAGDNNLMDIGRLSNARASQAAVATRDDLKMFFQSTQGQVPWQLDHVRRGLLNPHPPQQ